MAKTQRALNNLQLDWRLNIKMHKWSVSAIEADMLITWYLCIGYWQRLHYPLYLQVAYLREYRMANGNVGERQVSYQPRNYKKLARGHENGTYDTDTLLQTNTAKGNYCRYKIMTRVGWVNTHLYSELFLSPETFTFSRLCPWLQTGSDN
jgi:hypothetical protein